MADADVAMNGDRGLGQPAPSSAVPVAGAHTEQPERELKPGNPNLTGAAAPGPKKGMVDKVKDLFDGLKKGHHNNSGSAVGSGVGPDSSPYGTAADNQEFAGHALDPTAAPAGNTFRQQGAGSPGPWPHPTNPRHSQAQAGATQNSEHRNLQPGTQDDGVKKEGFLSKIKDKLHSPRSPKSTKSNQ